MKPMDEASPVSIEALAAQACTAVDRFVTVGILPSWTDETKTPPAFTHLVRWLIANQAASIAPTMAERLAHVIATACFGRHHLWQDLGLGGRDDVSRLLAACFPSVHAANVNNLKWKRFLFATLAAQHGGDPRPPSCAGCEDFPKCFPDEGGRV